MTDNFKNISNFLKSQNKIEQCNKSNNDSYYIIQLIKRSKDNPGYTNIKSVFKSYYINSLEDFWKYKTEIINLCDLLNLRAYIDVNSKSYKQVALNYMAEIAIKISLNDVNNLYNVYDNCSINYNNINDLLVIDVDKEEWMSNEDFEKYISLMRIAINNCKSINNNINIVFENPSKSGYHFVTRNFKLVEGVGGESKDNFPYQVRNAIKLLLGDKINNINEAYQNEWFESGIILNPSETMIHEDKFILLYENIK